MAAKSEATYFGSVERRQTVLMLLGSNSRDVVRAVGEKIKAIRQDLPAGVTVDVVYDRADFVGRTISTVVHNLVEGVLIVTLVLALFLGTIRGALAVVLGIPASMSFALMGMHAFGVTGDLMSLGAVDFGFLVDGPIVILEAVVAGTAGRHLSSDLRTGEYARIAGRVVRPVAFAVGIIMLVYIPLLGLQGVEGKMFRPMALTMASALFGAVVYSVVLFPAILTVLLPVPATHGPRWVAALSRRYQGIVGSTIVWRWPLLVGATLLLGLTSWRFSRSGADFVPRIFEGDAVVTIRRAPSISLGEARTLDLRAEKVLHSFPEVLSALAMTGRAEVATDPVGNDNTDILIRLAPQQQWTSAKSFDDLSVLFKDQIESQVAGTFVSVSQPIEDKTNELISGSRADVQINIGGSDLDELARLANLVGKRVATIAGAGDVRIERILGAPTITARAERSQMARYGVRVADAFAVIEGARQGIKVGTIYEGERRFELRVHMPIGAPTASALGDLFVETRNGLTIPLREVVALSESDGVAAVRRENRSRTVRVDVNLRGRDLVSWVADAKAAVAGDIPMSSGYQVGWGGQFENFERAKRRLTIVVPAVVLVIFGMLLLMFHNLRFAVAPPPRHRDIAEAGPCVR